MVHAGWLHVKRGGGWHQGGFRWLPNLKDVTGRGVEVGAACWGVVQEGCWSRGPMT